MPLTLLPPVGRPALPTLDAVQQSVVDHRGRALVVLGAPGTGKTTTAVHLVVDRIGSGALPAEEVLLVAPTRRAAGELRDTVSGLLGRTTGQPVVRTAASAAFSVLRARASLLGEPAPTLISGPEQDLVLADLLAGHAAGEGADIPWPSSVPPEARSLRAFRDELRDLLMRAAERGLGPADLRRLGRTHGRPEWVAASAVYAEYLAVTQLRAGTPDVGARLDPAVVVDEAAEALAAWGRELPGTVRPRWSLVVVDDHHESTAATVRLLHVLADGGADLVLLADPDSAVQTFRGASPALVDRATVAPPAAELGAFGAEQLVLPTVWRHGPVLRRVVRDVTEEIGGPSRRQRAATPLPETDAGDVSVALVRSPAQEAAFIAYVLRSAHLHDGVPWRRMAVVARSGALVADLRRALLGAQVPVAVVGSDLPLRSEPAVRPLLLAVARSVEPDALTADEAAELLTSPLGGLDAVALRRLRRALRAHEVAEGGGRASDPLLVEALGRSGTPGELPALVRRPLHRLTTVLAAGRAEATRAGAGVLDVLWAVWSATGLADGWRRAALAGGPGGARADRDLDAVLSLFKAAEVFVDRLPHAPARAFLEHLEGQDLPSDSLAAQGDAGDSVALVTPAGAAGGEWDVVVVAGVQEGSWPDLRLRDSMLGAQQLVEVLAGRTVVGADRLRDARAAVLEDELRGFAVAVSRARRRLVVTAVDDADHQPSPLLDLVDPGPDEGHDPRYVQVPPALDLRAVVAQARAGLERAVEVDDEPAQASAAHLLARLAAEEVPGAHPDDWYAVRPLTTRAPLWADDATVRLSPSRLESVSTCALRWALEEAGGKAGDSGEQTLGNLVHEVAAAVPDGGEEVLMAELDRRWSSLGLPDGWVGAVQRRRAEGMIRHLARYLATAGEAVAVEHPFRVELDGVVLQGVVDRVERVATADDGTPVLRVVDLKTGRKAVTEAEAQRHAQLGAYQVALRAGAFEDVTGPAQGAGASLVYVGTAGVKPCERRQVSLAEDADPAWVGALLEEVAGTVRRSVMEAHENELCRVCPVSRSCPVQTGGRTVGA